MLTQCDRCAAIFRVHPVQLRQAQGFVRCGACQQVFYAVGRLLEEARLDTDEANQAAAQLKQDQPFAAASGIAGAASGEQPAMAIARAPLAEATADLPRLRRDTADLEADTDEPERSIARPRLVPPVAPPATAEVLSEPDGPRIGISDLDVSAAAEDEELHSAAAAGGTLEDGVATIDEEPEVLRQDLAALRGNQAAGRDWRPLWAALALLLLLVLTAQVIWYFREPLLARFPTWREPVERWCETLGCRLGVNATPPQIELLARDVRDHPRFAEALLVNLTMVSGTATVQRYPLIDLRLFDASGQVLGQRRFSPEEYLDPSISAAGMQPSRPVFVVLELAGKYADAVGFEFDFP